MSNDLHSKLLLVLVPGSQLGKNDHVRFVPCLDQNFLTFELMLMLSVLMVGSSMEHLVS